jgi:hypothetical protein
MYHINAYMSSYNRQDPYVSINSGVFKYVNQEEEEKREEEKREEERQRIRERIEAGGEPDSMAAAAERLGIPAGDYSLGCDCVECDRVRDEMIVVE